jgi:hypothetical protein
MNSKIQNRVSGLVDEVRKLYSKHAPLNLTAAKRRFPDLVEAAYAFKPFLGWRKLLLAAGIAYEDIEREYRDFVTCKICGRKFRILTAHLIKTHAITPGEYRRAFPEAELMSETLRIARRGERRKPINRHTTLPHWEELWTPEYLLDRIEAYNEHGDSINFHSLQVHDKSTTEAAIRFFGSWDAAMARLGINPDEYRRQSPGIRLSPEEVIRGLKARRQKRLPLNESALSQSDLRLYNAARRRFGSYSKALEAAGIEPRSVSLKNRYSDEDLNKVIKAGHRINRLTGDERLKALKRLDRRYRPMVYGRYSSWRNFAVKQGFDTDKFSFTEQKEDLIMAIRKLPAGMTAGRLFEENRSLYDKIRKRIGQVSIALRKYHPVTHILRKDKKKVVPRAQKNSGGYEGHSLPQRCIKFENFTIPPIRGTKRD